MKQWYCTINGQQYGPVAEATFRQWIGEGRVVAESLVWAEGMPEWVRADSVPGLFDRAPGEPPVLPLPGQAAGSARRPGTGGKRANQDITSDARNALSGRWGLAIAFCLLLGLLQSGGGIPYLGPLIGLIVGGAFMVGAAVFFLTFVRGGNAEIGMLFAGFKNFGTALGAYMLQAIFVCLWMLLLIIPGIIAGLAYSQTFYLLAEDPSLGPLEAITKSKAMMKGHKGKLFCLQCRFIGWGLLCMLTCGIGLLWLMPYMQVSLAYFHEDLREPDGSESVANSSPFRGQFGVEPV